MRWKYWCKKVKIISENKISEEVKIDSENRNKCNYCILCIVLFSIFFTINIGIGAYFVYYWYFNRDKKTAFTCDYFYHTYKMREIKQINIKNRAYYFYNDIIDLKNFDETLLKFDKKSYKNIGIYNVGYITIKNIDDSNNIHSVNPLYLHIDQTSGYIEEKDVNKYLVFQ